MKAFKFFILFVLFSSSFFQAFSQKIKSNMKYNIEIGKEAFYAWQKGEKTGDYTNFKTLLSKNFIKFSHPLIGNFKGDTALFKIKDLIKERESTKNNLDFSEIQISNNGNSVTFQFNSKGTVQNDKFPYEGFNIIVIQINENKIIGFQEYFGFIDPNWFKN